MKFLRILILAFISINDLYAQGTERFELYFSTYNHVEGIDSYKITNEEIVVSVKGLVDEKDNVVYISKMRQDIFEKTKSIKFQSLEDSYFNNCIMATSGSEYFIGFRYGAISKQISLHHYYQKNIANLVELINLSVPEEYHIDYVGEDTQQYCP
ncbi:hypothetical protein HYN59_03250 [Flavobacterium album]|uniref:Uncharacterized protein n=1 Tax=Flavobacterium album TaxID=2175091 RepID=A0A2S1QUU2_9FLAO|nr:hypothetical protein [Flavobacterium album]AWH84188.1 hypothetical protein HYN59_03250 [Flavobacterium album]